MLPSDVFVNAGPARGPARLSQRKEALSGRAVASLHPWRAFRRANRNTVLRRPTRKRRYSAEIVENFSARRNSPKTTALRESPVPAERMARSMAAICHPNYVGHCYALR
jgi:hypothetical protein